MGSASLTRIAGAEVLHGIMENMRVLSESWPGVGQWRRGYGLAWSVAVAAQAAGGPSPGEGPVSAGLVPPGLCQSFAQLDHLVVRRFDAFPQNHIHFSFPATVTVSRPAAVQKAAGRSAPCRHAGQGPALPSRPRDHLSPDLLRPPPSRRLDPRVVGLGHRLRGLTGLGR